jgi:hypothetical protein
VRPCLRLLNVYAIPLLETIVVIARRLDDYEIHDNMGLELYYD